MKECLVDIDTKCLIMVRLATMLHKQGRLYSYKLKGHSLSSLSTLTNNPIVDYLIVSIYFYDGDLTNQTCQYIFLRIRS